MLKFNEILLEKYGDTITNLSKTGQNNFIKNSFRMIDLDKMSKSFPKINKDFKGQEFSTADALYINNSDNEIILYFFEFKKIDFNKEKDQKMAGYELNRAIEKMKNCEHDCFINYDKSSFPKYLIDKYNLSLIKKPYESLSLLCHFFELV